MKLLTYLAEGADVPLSKRHLVLIMHDDGTLVPTFFHGPTRDSVQVNARAFWDRSLEYFKAQAGAQRRGPRKATAVPAAPTQDDDEPEEAI